DRVTSDLRGWTPDLPAAGRALATAHHSADAHAVELVALLGELGVARAPAPARTAELERLVRLEWQTWRLYRGALDEIRSLRRTLDERNDALEQLHEELTEAHQHYADLRRHFVEKERTVAEQHHTLTEQHRILDEQIVEIDRLLRQEAER